MFDLKIYDHILQFLSLFDLYNLAMTNRRLRSAAVREFRYRFWRRDIFINDITDSAPSVIMYDIYLNGYELVLNFLRIFGSQIRILTVSEHEELPEKIGVIGSYISLYCPSLTELNFHRLHTDISINFSRSFPTVQNVSFFRSQIGDRLSNLNRWFPHARCITFFRWNCVHNYDRLIVTYPFLERFYLHFTFFGHDRLNSFVALNQGVRIRFFDEDSD